MATYTTNLNLKKPATSDKIRIADFNNNADLIDAGYGDQDTSMGKLGGGLAIISTGNVHAAISAGDYVYVRKHGTLTEGLYTADSAISANGTLSSSNVTAVSGGGLNALNSKITGNSYSNSGLTFTDCALVVGGYAKCGNIVIINMRLSVTSASPKINGFPAYGQQLSSNKNAVSCSMSDSSNTLPSGAESYLTYSGELRLYNCNTSNEYIVSTVYISNS